MVPAAFIDGPAKKKTYPGGEKGRKERESK